MNSTQIKQIDMVKILAILNIRPQKIRGFDFWYLSPFRDEKTPSFKVDTKQNVWIDFGLSLDSQRGGSIIDFVMLYYRMSFKAAISKLNEILGDDNFSFHRQSNPLKPDTGGQKKKIEVIAASPITAPALCHYLHHRNISLSLAREYCEEVHYHLYGKEYYALGFRNNSGGYELRNAYFKGSSSPKDITLIGSEEGNDLTVFEGFFSFLSLLSFKEEEEIKLSNRQHNYLILNSLSFFRKAKETMDNFKEVHLFLDNDSAGNRATDMALKWGDKYHDRRGRYTGYKDLNEKLTQTQSQRNQRKGRRL